MGRFRGSGKQHYIFDKCGWHAAKIAVKNKTADELRLWVVCFGLKSVWEYDGVTIISTLPNYFTIISSCSWTGRRITSSIQPECSGSAERGQCMCYLATHEPETAILAKYQWLRNSSSECTAKAVGTPFRNIGDVAFSTGTSNSYNNTIVISKHASPRYLPGALGIIVKTNRHIVAVDRMRDGIQYRKVNK